MKTNQIKTRPMGDFHVEQRTRIKGQTMSTGFFSQEFIVDAFRSIRKEKRQYKTYIFIDNAAGLYKIGRAVDIEKRLNTLSVANANLSVALTIGYDVENELHKTYSKKKVKSEWFRLTEKDIEDINHKYNGPSL